MAFPTATVTQGSGLTINTLPNAGQATMANSLGVAIASDQSAFPVTSLSSGAITNPTSTLARPANSVANVAVSRTVSPYFTWSGNPPLVNGQGVILGGTTIPAGFNVGLTYYVRDVAGNAFNLAGTVGAAAIVPTSTGTAVTAQLYYKPNDLVGSAGVAGSIVVPSFSIASAAGGAILPRIRIRTSLSPFSWQGVNLSINLWSAAPTYTNGDAQPYAIATGSATWLANYLVTLTQFGDGAVGAAQLTGANEMALKLASGTAVYWDLQILSYVGPAASQTFTLIPELLN
jgi:hypothetical protein